MRQTGGLDFGRADNPTLLATRDNLHRARLPYEWLDPAAVQERFPQFRLDADMMAVYQPDAGYLAASECVLAMANAAAGYGATIRTQTRVTNCEVQADSVTIETTTATYSAGRVVITAGAWAAQILGLLDLPLPLLPTREQLVFFDPADAALFTPERCPIYISHGEPTFYGIANISGKGFKAAVHGGGQATNPDNTNRVVDPEYIERVRGFIQQHIPQADGPVKEARVCLYTMTPDEDFIIDCHPAYPHVIFGAGFSGHGFKFGVLIGKILADLALEGATSHNISRFKVARFLPA
jgi:monomeric sarcosine oxidase